MAVLAGRHLIEPPTRDDPLARERHLEDAEHERAETLNRPALTAFNHGYVVHETPRVRASCVAARPRTRSARAVHDAAGVQVGEVHDRAQG